MAEKVVLNQKAIDIANAKKKAADEAAAKARAEASAKSATTLAAKQAQLDALKGRIDYKTGTSNVKPIDYAGLDVLGATTDIARKDMAKALTDAQLAEATAAGITIPEMQYASQNDQSAFDLITLELQNKGLSSLIEPLKKLFQDGITDSDSLRLKLSQTPEYQTRFSANAERIKNGLSALTPAEYVQLEDQYQNVMRNYGLPSTYWTKDATGKQAGFDALLAGDVSATELEDRVMTAQERVVNANPEVSKALKQFYGDTITDGDILAYALDPSKALTDIKRKVTAAEIGGAALQAGLNQGTTPEMYKSYAARAAELAAAGVTQTEAQQNYGTIAQLAQRGSQLADIYGQGPYGQAQAESELFNIQGQTQAAAQRKKLTGLEKAAFSASSGAAQNALSRDRAMQSGTARSSGAGGF